MTANVNESRYVCDNTANSVRVRSHLVLLLCIYAGLVSIGCIPCAEALSTPFAILWKKQTGKLHGSTQPAESDIPVPSERSLIRKNHLSGKNHGAKKGGSNHGNDDSSEINQNDDASITNQQNIFLRPKMQQTKKTKSDRDSTKRK
ncbi:hypothetical protein IV203_004603 [Nitzschia inconspicua]|uniref:Uncharacterized protein n=1 Tax=Nitzschia inconspicua TaxID=303405 RepID=A0A9K3L4C5_9STRA|nr:hypothetical protein IV203_004603 [Nitzschia inconspicua]